MRLAEHIASKGMTIPAWARAKGFPVGTVAKWASGQRVPRPGQMRRLRDATDGEVTSADFFEATPASNAVGEAA